MGAINDLDPAEAGNHDELIECLKLLHTRADTPSLRELEQRTTHLSGKLPGTGLKRVRLGRSAVSEMLRGVKFPRKAFLLTFVEACGIDVAADRRREKAWNRLAPLQPSQLAENDARQARDTARSEIERLQADRATQTAELERTRAEAAHALEAAQAETHTQMR